MVEKTPTPLPRPRYGGSGTYPAVQSGNYHERLARLEEERDAYFDVVKRLAEDMADQFRAQNAAIKELSDTLKIQTMVLRGEDHKPHEGLQWQVRRHAEFHATWEKMKMVVLTAVLLGLLGFLAYLYSGRVQP